MLLAKILELDQLDVETKIDKLTDLAHTLNLASEAIQKELKILLDQRNKEKKHHGPSPYGPIKRN